MGAGEIFNLIISVTNRAVICYAYSIAWENFHFYWLIFAIANFGICFNSFIIGKTSYSIIRIRSTYKWYISVVITRWLFVVKPLADNEDINKIKDFPFYPPPKRLIYSHLTLP